MIAVLGGIGAALCWAVSIVCSSRSSRRMDALAVVAWMMLVGLLITVPLALAVGVPHDVSAAAWGWLALSGGGNVAGLVISYRALRSGQVSLVAPLVSTEGAIAAVIALIAGERVAVGTLVCLGAIVAGVCAAAMPTGEPSAGGRQGHLRTVMLATLSAVSFGASLYATGRAGIDLPSAWVVLSARAIGSLALALPLAARARLRIASGTLPLLLASGCAEVAGFFSFTWGAGHGIAVASVLSSQFAVVALVAAYLLFGERLGRLQLSGVAIVVAGVAILSVLRA
jgi:drug/metabolite transporter (DMT)-like permease